MRLQPTNANVSPSKLSVDEVFLYRRRPLSKDLVRDRLKAVGKRIGVKVSPHRLRHTFAKNLVDAGTPLDQVATLLGHESLDTTRVYTQPSERDLERAYQEKSALTLCPQH